MQNDMANKMAQANTFSIGRFTVKINGIFLYPFLSLVHRMTCNWSDPLDDGLLFHSTPQCTIFTSSVFYSILFLQPKHTFMCRITIAVDRVVLSALIHNVSSSYVCCWTRTSSYHVHCSSNVQNRHCCFVLCQRWQWRHRQSLLPSFSFCILLFHSLSIHPLVVFTPREREKINAKHIEKNLSLFSHFAQHKNNDAFVWCDGFAIYAW